LSIHRKYMRYTAAHTHYAHLLCIICRVLFRNSTTDFISYYQWPHNLPPYAYLGEGFPSDFFCYGLPGNTLPLGR
jgi:hypothetical protein